MRISSSFQPGAVFVALSAGFASLCLAAHGQGTAFIYQGRLDAGGAAAGGVYDLRFAVYDAAANGNPVSGAVTNSATTVSNGLFCVALDFGPGVFAGPERWLELAVRTNGASGFSVLEPRQPLLPAPYAVMAGAASNLLGTLPAAQLSGAVPDSLLSSNVALLNANQAFTGQNTFQNAVQVRAQLSMNDQDIRLRDDDYHGLGWYGYSKPFGTVAPDGPVLYGYGGGALGTRRSGNFTNLALVWNSSGNVGIGIGTNNPQSTLDVNGTVRATILQASGATVSSLQVSGQMTLSSLQVNGAVSAGNFIGDSCVLLGTNGVPLGQHCVAQANGVALGYQCYAAANGVALGYQCDAGVNGVALGRMCVAGEGSFAAGDQVYASRVRCFVWSDGSLGPVSAPQTNSVMMVASGGFTLRTGQSSGASLYSGSGSWVSNSDRNAKTNFAPVDTDAVLEKVAALPLSTWNYRSQAPSIRHLGPMAQDFMAAFEIGDTNTGISTVDADGVALAAIQALAKKMKSENAALRAENAELKTRLEKLEQAVNATSPLAK